MTGSSNRRAGPNAQTPGAAGSGGTRTPESDVQFRDGSGEDMTREEEIEMLRQQLQNERARRRRLEQEVASQSAFERVRARLRQSP